MTRAATRRTVLASILFIVFITAPVWAQLSTAELNGRVTDSSGAVLPGVTVTVADGTVQRLGQDVEGIFGTKVWR